jgi:hypothetical protein
VRYAADLEDDSLAAFSICRLADAIESTAPKSSRRRVLVLTLSEQLRAVPLRLFEPVLERVKTFVRQEEGGEEKESLVQALFGALSRGVDATKRADAVSWWLANVDEL